MLGDTDAEVFVNQLLRPYLQYKPTFESIEHLSACLKTPTIERNAPETMGSELSSIDGEIEFSTKLANSLSVPSQKSVELVSKNSFKWYEPLHLAASKDPKLSAAFFSLGLSSLQKGTLLIRTSIFNYEVLIVQLIITYPCSFQCIV